MQASVVIRAKNEARFIGETLEALFSQGDLQSYEVIVVDSGSTDDTVRIVKRFPARLIEIPAESFTYGRALNIGIGEALGEIIASLSAHSLPAHERWLASMLVSFRNSRVAGVAGRQLPRENATPLELLGMRLSGVTSTRPLLRSRNPMFSNANGAFRRTLWQKVPFDEQVAGAEDIAWARSMQALGYLIAYEPQAAVYHSHGEPLLKHLRRTMHDAPTVLGNVLGLGNGRERDKQPRPGILPEK